MKSTDWGLSLPDTSFNLIIRFLFLIIEVAYSQALSTKTKCYEKVIPFDYTSVSGS
jgi:hypothetical protein